MFPGKMMVWYLLVTLASAAALAAAQSSAPCTVVHTEDIDDSPAVYTAISSCPAGQPIVFTPNTSYNIFTPLVLNNSDLTLSIQGNLSLPTNITQIQAAVNASASGFWFYFTGSGVNVTGSTDPYNGWIESHGQQWWNAANTIARPHLWGFAVDGGYLYNLKFLQPIAWTVSLSGANNVYVGNTLIDARSTGAFPFNTDGFDATGSNLIIEDSVIYNGDDAFAVGQNSGGTQNITFRRAFVGFQSHGLSIGSLGKDPAEPANVSDILVENVFLENTLYGARFKSWVGGTGSAKNVTYKNIGVRNVTFPLYITQSYVDQNSPGGTRVNNASVVMQNFTYENFFGDINTFHPGDGSCVTDPCWYYEPDADGTQAAILRCSADACQDFTLKNIHLRPQSGVPATILCNNQPIDSSDLGIVCQNGTFVETGQ